MAETQFRQISVLTSNIKTLLKTALTEYFDGDPSYRKKLKIVNKKSDLEKFSYGILFRNVSASKIQFSPDNYLGKIRAFASLAGAGNHPSRIIDFVCDDDYNIYHAVYDLDISSQAAGTNMIFNLPDHMTKQSRETGQPSYADSPENVRVQVDGRNVLVSKTDGFAKTVTLDKAPPIGSVVTATYLKKNVAPPGYYFVELQANNQVVVDQFEAIERLPIAFKMPEVKLFFTGGVLSSTDIKILVDGTELTTGFTIVKAGNYIIFDKMPVGTQIQIRNRQTNAILSAGVSWFFKRYKEEVLVTSATGVEQYLFLTEPTYENLVVTSNGRVLTSDRDVPSILDPHDYNIAGNRLELLTSLSQFSETKATYIYKDPTVAGVIPISNIFGDVASVQLLHTNIFDQMFEVYRGPNLVPPSSYTVDFVNGLLTFLDLPLVGDDYVVCYRMFRGTLGPFPVKPMTWDNKIIPGAILYFGRRFEVGDKIVVIIGDQQKECADEYGGKWELSVELGVVALDPIVSAQLADELVMYLWAGLKPKWDSVGLFIQDVSHSGESEEETDEVTGNTDFQASVSLTVIGDWFLRVPRKYRLMSISNTQTVNSSNGTLASSTETLTSDNGTWEPEGLFLPDFRNGTTDLYKYVPERVAKGPL